MSCNLNYDSFTGKTAGDAYLDITWKCRTCQLPAGAHPAPILPPSSVLEMNSPRLAKSVFLFCDINKDPVGSCFIVSPNRVVTAYHCISYTSRIINNNWFAIKSLERMGSNVISTDVFPLIVKKSSFSSDWAVLERTDGLVFDSNNIISICEELPPQEVKIKMYSCPIDLFLQGSMSALQALSCEGRLGFYTNHKVFYQISGFSGSSGGLVSFGNSALGMHLVGVNAAKLVETIAKERDKATRLGEFFDSRDDLTFASDSHAQATGIISEAIVLIKIRTLIAAIRE